MWFWLAMTFVIAATAFVSFSWRNPNDNAPAVARTTRWRFVANTSFAQWAHAQAVAWEQNALPPVLPKPLAKTPSDDIVSWLLDDEETPSNEAHDAQNETEWWLFTLDGTLLTHRDGTSNAADVEARLLAQKAAQTERVIASRPEVLATPDATSNETNRIADNQNSAETARATAQKKALSEAQMRDALLASSTRTPRGRRVVFVARLSFSPEVRAANTREATARRAFPLAFFFLRGEPLTRTLRLLTMLLTTSLFCLWLARHVTRPVRQLRATVHQISSGQLDARSDQQVVRRNDELGDLGRDFDTMAARLETLISAQRRLVGDVSHELRSPLARLGIALELARRHASNVNTTNEKSSTRSTAQTQTAADEGEMPLTTSAEAFSAEALQNALNRIEREAARLEEMVAQLLTLSRFESGALMQNEASFDVMDVLRGVAADARFEAHSQGRDVRIETMSHNVDRWTQRGEAALLRSALENVLRNAMRFAPDGSVVRIESAIESAIESVGAAGKRIVIRILDSGPGVPDDALPKLFQPFYRVDDARDRQSGGTGLGLAIAERAVHLHGGTICAFNRETGGLCVEISLPLNTPIQNYEK